MDSGSPCPAGTSLVRTEKACVSGTGSDDVLATRRSGGIACVNANQEGTSSGYVGDWMVRILCKGCGSFQSTLLTSRR